MKIGVIYYSYSGHTKLVVDQLVMVLKGSGADVSKIVLEPENPLQLSAITVPLKEQPDVSGLMSWFWERLSTAVGCRHPCWPFWKGPNT